MAGAVLTRMVTLLAALTALAVTPSGAHWLHPELLDTSACKPCEISVSMGPGGNLLAIPVHHSDASREGDEPLATATFHREYEETGWDRLEVKVRRHAEAEDVDKARAAGFAEGVLQADRIYQYWTNYRMNELNNTEHMPTPGLLAWLAQQERHVRLNIATRGSSSTYWHRMGLVMAQLDGLCSGIWTAARPGQNLTYWEIYVLQSVGDLYDLSVLFPQHDSTAGHLMGKTPQRQYTPGHGMVGPEGYGGGELLECSALIKLDPTEAQATNAGPLQQTASQRRLLSDPLTGPSQAVGGRNFWAGHTTWRPFYAMLRTWKIYDFPWGVSGPVAVSSSPGFVGYSKDDWYTTGRFVIIETTNGIYNPALYDSISPECALMWQRVQVANLGAGNGSDWVELFQMENSGTYNNQWMVLDVDKLSAGAVSDVLWVLEQLPGTVETADVTGVLMSQGHWPSFNVPYFKRIYNMSGYPSSEDVHSTCPRAKIFARDQGAVRSLEDFQHLLRLNRYQEDPLSNGDATHVISARYDLSPVVAAGDAAPWTPRAHGAVDAKVVSLESFRSGGTYVINGPTNEDQPTFSWSEFCRPTDVSVGRTQPNSSGPSCIMPRHEGLVDKFCFPWQLVAPTPAHGHSS